MKHAAQDTLALLEPLLSELRKSGALVEKTPGSFYLRSKAFLHFHEDPAGLFADLKEDLVSFSRYRVSSQPEQEKLLAIVKRCISGLPATSGARGK